MQGWSKTVPVKALQMFEMAQFLEKLNWAWTPEQYRAARAGDIAWLREYWALTAPSKTETAEDRYV